ncbi:MAG: hypothetical protein ACTH1I_01395 [Brevibacterium aurantiacum]|uniref:Putative membrane protein n=1 Tax=Brevibacterium aurantiacum TaxID=273384 RepID=A0A1D7W6R1_BREAU|nr:hypothetical protein [Brevibacterium aurantiacum]MDN5549683.1 hypothetical protein [Brevibacterium sp.]AOP54328.1 putative membrane protein [Brevibacterium aurantiacum]AZL13601.1 hypothetical protein CXR25_12840 [Brevibacterium aurantiacum]MDN5593158.1 hypothetical protein [Brevibacterium sp.]MDN5607623.1 hypothetical protein [Brevibacterium sp.]
MSKANELTKTAGAFDIRNFIGVLLGIFGIILTIAGVVGYTPDEAERTGGIDANLWTGIGLILTAAFFLIWAKLRPIRIIADDAAEVVDTDPRD